MNRLYRSSQRLARWHPQQCPLPLRCPASRALMRRAVTNVSATQSASQPTPGASFAKHTSTQQDKSSSVLSESELPEAPESSPNAEACDLSMSDVPPKLSKTSNMWFVDDPQDLEFPNEPTWLQNEPLASPPPANLPLDLKPLYDHLTDSPFIDRSSITFIDAKTEKGESAWTDWVVLVNLKEGRERSIRGATDAIRLTLSKTMRVRTEGAETEAQPASWAMVDAGKVVVHILTPDAREIYDLESVWTTRG